MMNTASILARLRKTHQAVMVDACTITRTTVGTLNETTGVYAETTATIYAGKCRIKPAQTSTVDAGSIAVDASRPTLSIPWTEAGVVQPGDAVTIASGPLAGTTAEIYAEVAGTTSTSRLYTLEVQA